MKRYINLCFIIIMFMMHSPLSAQQFKQEDRDRLVRLETKIEISQNTIQKQFEFTQKQIDDLKSFILWGFGILFGGMGILIGFVIWDRRTALEPIAKKNKELQEREEKLERVIREYAKAEPKLAKILRSINL